ncbi:unnamed protein product, partial [Sphacelaria rigidula]
GRNANSVEKACEAANRNWSLAEAEAAVLRSFRVFVEVCVLRRQPGYLPTTAAPELQLSNPASTPTRSSNQGGVSPARTPVGGASTSNRGAGGIAGLGGGGGDGGAGRDNAQKNSDFLGDNRSFVMMNICANRLAGEKRKGWAAANVVAEMCEALVSMLHHQLHEVVMKALDPRRSIVRRRDPRLGRLSSGTHGQMGPVKCDETLRLLAPALETLFDVAPLSRVLDVDEGVGVALEANAISRATTISLCLRVRLRLLTAGLVLLRAAGQTAEEVVAAQAAAKEGRTGTINTTDLNRSINGSKSNDGSGAGRFSSQGRRNGHTNSRAKSEHDAKMSVRARLQLLRAACGTLQELDALEDALRTSTQRTRGHGGKRGTGSWMRDGVVEAEGDRTLRANLASVCVSIMEEMTLPRGRWGFDEGEEAGGENEGSRGFVHVMEREVERIVREEKVIPRLLSRAARASRLACASYPGLHSTPAPDATTAAARNGVGGSNGFAMDVDDGDSGGGGSGGGGNKGSGTPGVGGVESAEGVELLQLIYSFFASAAARGVSTSLMVDGGVLPAMASDPLLALVRQTSADRQVYVACSRY